MKQLIIIVISAVLIFSVGYFLDSSSIPEQQELVSKADNKVDSYIDVPKFEFNTLEGKKISLESFRGKVIILNFWASWCGPCKEEFPLMKEIVDSSSDVVLFAISSDENKKDVYKFLKEMKKDGVDLTEKGSFIAHDPLKDISSGLFNVLRLPETFIINKDYKIVKKVIGSHLWVNQEMAKFIKEL